MKGGGGGGGGMSGDSFELARRDVGQCCSLLQSCPGPRLRYVTPGVQPLPHNCNYHSKSIFCTVICL